MWAVKKGHCCGDRGLRGDVGLVGVKVKISRGLCSPPPTFSRQTDPRGGMNGFAAAKTDSDDEALKTVRLLIVSDAVDQHLRSLDPQGVSFPRI